MSKLAKLIAQPVQFFQDALANAQVRATLGKLPTDERRPATSNGDLPLAEALLRALSGTTDVFMTPSPSGYEELNCFAYDIPWVIYHALLLAQARKGRLVIQSRRKVIDVSRDSLVSGAGRVMTAPDFEVRIVRKDGGEEMARLLVWEHRASEGIYWCRAQNTYAKALPVEAFERLRDRETGRLDLRKLYECPVDSECAFDVDVVYTWVNHSDPEWRSMISRFKDLDAIEWHRYQASDELKYSLRSIHAFAPWARQIYVVTNCARPAWLAEHPKVRWVMHEEVFPRSDAYLPTFNSHAIESCLMRIDGLSEHFVYMNDDVFLGKPSAKIDFFATNGVSISFLESYGTVIGEVDKQKPDYLNAAIRGRKLIEDTFGVSPTQLHTHVPHALRKSVLIEMETRFPHEFDDVRRARFRSRQDVSVASFLYHHYAFQTCRATRASTATSVLVRPSNSAEAFVQMLAGKPKQFFCINDTGTSITDDGFQARTAKFLSTYYPDKAPWEV